MPSQQEYIQPYLEQFEAFERALNGESAAPVHASRKNAIAALAEKGFPTIKHEDWRYTSLSQLLSSRFSPSNQLDESLIGSDLLDRLQSTYTMDTRLVFVNGFQSERSSSYNGLPPGVVISSLAAAMETHAGVIGKHLGSLLTSDANGFAALNAAFIRDGAFVYVPKNTAVETPIHFLFLTANAADVPALSQPRILVIAEPGSEVKLVEMHTCERGGVYFSNPAVEIVAGANAHVEHYKIQRESEEAYHISNNAVSIERSARYFSLSLMFGGRLVRNNITMRLAGEGAEGTLNGLYMPRNKQHVDNYTLIDHAVPNCSSHEVYKGLLGDESRGVFSGKIIVRPDAQKTDAKQSNNNILLSNKAVVDTKPQLEIFADDVRCTHGATIGRLDEKAIFYLRSRGLDMEEAFDVLSYAFASDLIEDISIEALRTHLDAFIHRRLKETTHL